MTKRKILLVDDDNAVLDFLQTKLGGRYDLVSTNAPANVLKLARQHVPQLRVRVVNVVDLMALLPPDAHPHGFSEERFIDLFTRDAVRSAGPRPGSSWARRRTLSGSKAIR